MDIINVLVSGEDKSGKSTFASALRLTKFGVYNLNVVDIANNNQSLKKYDVLFYVMNVETELDETSVATTIENIDQCLFIPIFNKLDLYDFTIDDKTGKITLPEEIIQKMNVKLDRLNDLFDGVGQSFCRELILCSAEYAYMYLYMSTCTKTTSNSDPNIVSKLGQYELGKLQWNKKTSIDKSTYASALTDTLKKVTKLTTILNGVGYTIQPIIQKYMTDQRFVQMVQKHLIELHETFMLMATSENIINVLNYMNNNFKCITDPTFLSTYSDMSNITTSVANYINTYDYTSLDFYGKSDVLQFYRNAESQLFKTIDTSSNINFLTAILSQEIGTQLGSCESFYELVDKLYDCLDINDDMFVDQILLGHKTFKTLLFSNDLYHSVEYALSKFDLDAKLLFFQIMEMKLTALLSLNEHEGMIESMMCVQEFLDTHLDLNKTNPELTRYRILLKYGLNKAFVSYNINTELLLNKINDEHTLYIESIYYDLMLKTKEDSEESDTSDEEDEVKTVTQAKLSAKK